MKRKIVIGSRESRLAVRQAEIVMEIIAAEHPGIELEIRTFKTTGDRILDRRLDEVGGKGLFVKELDAALRDKKIDIAVHSLKDMPMETPADLPIVAFSKREDARDAIVFPQKTDRALRVIGCSSARRALQLKEMLPDSEIKPVRGNIHTRLEKLDRGEYTALVLASAGLRRMGLEGRIGRLFAETEMIPAAGQGILAVQGRAGEDYGFVSCVNDEDAASCARAERAFVRALGGGCTEPIAAFAKAEGSRLLLRGLYYDEETRVKRVDSIEGLKKDAEALGCELAARIKRECE